MVCASTPMAADSIFFRRVITMSVHELTLPVADETVDALAVGDFVDVPAF